MQRKGRKKMENILFRGKNSIGEWVEGDLMHGVRHQKGKAYIWHEIADDSFDIKEYEVIPETIGQYTGLTDKNGKKMFVGDIVAGAVTWQEHRKNGIVTFRDGSFGLLWYRGEIEQFNPFTSMCNIVYEVIGNIHDNPELLKGGVE
jgi:uncharacterized phage protein (TIGR01671 family)